MSIVQEAMGAGRSNLRGRIKSIPERTRTGGRVKRRSLNTFRVFNIVIVKVDSLLTLESSTLPLKGILAGTSFRLRTGYSFPFTIMHFNIVFHCFLFGITLFRIK
ncbi:hypothetical protein CDAR_520991 [Caerostris darwini]|uniref:Uncharacterized protein n=1 Tax=Caerostris darwini TaxID=1538125 RepID=A0AAV4V9M0_9ARAC|nr:hypothetical protein CDAR_520991 [Caerostris darwini]